MNAPLVLLDIHLTEATASSAIILAINAMSLIVLTVPDVHQDNFSIGIVLVNQAVILLFLNQLKVHINLAAFLILIRSLTSVRMAVTSQTVQIRLYHHMIIREQRENAKPSLA